MIKHKQY